MAAARSGAFASVACPCQGFLLRILGKWRRCRAGVSIGCCCLVAFRAKHFGVIKPVAAIPSLMVNIETPRSCASCHKLSPFSLPAIGISAVCEEGRIPSTRRERAPVMGYFFFFMVSVTVVFGCFFAYPVFTNLPLMALRDAFTFVAIFILLLD